MHAAISAVQMSRSSLCFRDHFWHVAPFVSITPLALRWSGLLYSGQFGRDVLNILSSFSVTSHQFIKHTLFSSAAFTCASVSSLCLFLPHFSISNFLLFSLLQPLINSSSAFPSHMLQSATWSCCRLSSMSTWPQTSWLWVLVLVWSGPGLWGRKMVLCTRLDPEAPNSSLQLSVDFSWRLYIFCISLSVCVCVWMSECLVSAQFGSRMDNWRQREEVPGSVWHLLERYQTFWSHSCVGKMFLKK